MRAMFGFAGLLVALVIVGVLVKKQMAASQAPLPTVPALQGSAADAPPTVPAAPAATVRAQSQQMQHQVQQQMNDLMQQARPMPEDIK